MTIMKPTRSVDWTKERISALTTPDVKQLRANAERLNEPKIMELCDAVLGERPRGAGAKPKGGARQPAARKNPQPGGAA